MNIIDMTVHLKEGKSVSEYSHLITELLRKYKTIQKISLTPDKLSFSYLETEFEE